MPEFVLGDKLPLVSEAVMAIISYAPGNHSSQKQKDAIKDYGTMLLQIWSKGFGNEHILTRNSIKDRLTAHVKEYFNVITNKKNRETLTKRARIQLWRAQNMNLLNIFKSNVDPSTFEEPERRFFEGQNSPSRWGYISEEIDVEYEERIAERRREEAAEEQRIQEELLNQQQEMNMIFGDDFNEDEDESFMNSSQSSIPDSMNASMNASFISTRSGLLLIPKDDATTQTDPLEITKPSIRSLNNKNCSDNAKSACAKLSSKTGLSAEMSRVGVQTVCKEMYNHQYHLEPQTTSGKAKSCILCI